MSAAPTVEVTLTLPEPLAREAEARGLLSPAQAEQLLRDALSQSKIAVPLRRDESGAIRVGDSQVLLDVVIREYKNGADAESIVHAYSTLRLADTYAVIAYYLQNREEVDTYLRNRRAEAEKLRLEIEAKQPDRGEFRARLLARRAQMEQAHAAPGE